MAAPPQGLSRYRGQPAIFSLHGGADPKAIRGDLDTLALAVKRIQERLTLIDMIFSGRINEMLLSGDLADRPPAGIRNRIYVATDQPPGIRSYFDNGSAWISLP